MIRQIIEDNWAREVEFLKSLVRVPSDNPPGDCLPHAEATALGLEELGFTVEWHPVPIDLVHQNEMTSATNLIVRKSFGAGKGPPPHGGPTHCWRLQMHA